MIDDCNDDDDDVDNEDEDDDDDDDDDDFLQTSYGRYGCAHDYHVPFPSGWVRSWLVAILAPIREQWRATFAANASTAHAQWEDTGSTRKLDGQTGHQYLKRQMWSVGAKNKTHGVPMFDDVSSALNPYFFVIFCIGREMISFGMRHPIAALTVYAGQASTANARRGDTLAKPAHKFGE
jgi:hypothetical protein